MQAIAGHPQDGVVIVKEEDIDRARAGLYAFLSRMFLEEPPRELAWDIANGRFRLPDCPNEDFAEGARLIGKFMEEGKDAAKVHNELCSEYTRLFVGPAPVMFPYESRYIDGSMMAKSLLRVKKEYRRAGLVRAKGFHEPEDHISAELAFMGYLCGSGNSQAAQRDFLDNHLLRWVPGFCDELFRNSSSDFFRGIGKLTRGFLALEKDSLENRTPER